MTPVTKPFSKFSQQELQCKGTGVILLDPRFVDKLTTFREDVYKKPIHPSSVCRTPEHNDKVGGHPSSLHLTKNPKHNTLGTAAIDCKWRHISTEEQLAFAALAYKHGFSVGLHNGFCHLDLRTVAGLAQHVFIYGTWDNAFSAQDVVSRSRTL